MSSKVETLEKRIETILKNREKELAALNDAVTDDRQRMESASKSLEAATAANDIEAYRRAKAEKELASDLAALHEARTEMLQAKNLITEEEYISGRDAVLDEVNTLVTANNGKAAALLAELERIAEDDRRIIDRANKALLKWQRDIFRDPELMRNGIVIEHRLAHCNLSPVITMSAQISERTDYKQIIGKE